MVVDCFGYSQALAVVGVLGGDAFLVMDKAVASLGEEKAVAV